MAYISHLVEPSRIKIIWRAVGSETRTRFVVGELVRAGDNVALYYHLFSNDFYAARQLGFVGHPAFDISIASHHHNVLEIFGRRLPPHNRSDFAMYLEKNRLRFFPQLSTFTLLGYTGGRLPGDGFSFEVDFTYENLPVQFLSEIAGFRYYSGMTFDMSLLPGQQVTFESEPTNPHDQNAMKVVMSGHHIGYVSRSLAPILRYWQSYAQITANIERIDGSLIEPQVHMFITVVGRYDYVSAARLAQNGSLGGGQLTTTYY